MWHGVESGVWVALGVYCNASEKLSVHTKLTLNVSCALAVQYDPNLLKRMNTQGHMDTQ